MTPEEVLYLENTFLKTIDKKINDSIWIKAFDEYNLERAYPISMNCVGCYVKVFKHHYDIIKKGA